MPLRHVTRRKQKNLQSHVAVHSCPGFQLVPQRFSLLLPEETCRVLRPSCRPLSLTRGPQHPWPQLSLMVAARIAREQAAGPLAFVSSSPLPLTRTSAEQRAHSTLQSAESKAAGFFVVAAVDCLASLSARDCLPPIVISRKLQREGGSST
jgi:hypothetical protein